MPSRAAWPLSTSSQEPGRTVSAQHDDVERFAALLRQLKERTDRSYGSLARRLHMNTSTLHRYCAGDAVPVDFAPVERFAALCGASAPERHELHRVWLLAVAARQRARTPATGDAALREATEDAGQETAEEQTGQEEQREQEEQGAQEEQREQEADAGQGEEGKRAPDITGRPTTPWYRRRRTAIAAAVCAALLATLGTLSALPAGERAKVVDAAPGSGTVTGTPERATGVPSPTGTTGSPSPVRSSPAPSTTPPREPPAKGGTPDGPLPKTDPPTPRATVPTGVPLTWSADSHAWALGCGHDYVIDRPPAQVPPPPVAQDARAWATAQGAVHGKDTNVRITVQGRSATAVVLEALRVRVVGRAAPVQGSSYAMDQGCGGSVTPRFFDVDLDMDRPIARSVPGADPDRELPAVRMPYQVSSTDPEVLEVTARTAGCACDWYLELDWSSQGRTGTVRIDDGGRPFRTSAVAGLDRYAYDYENRGWAPYTS
ncbi:helix-turn-helix domain-containing protein [Streptomyces sp. NPDC056716]|uniref:helix-turn-helix domain-containing protein n=1 Tax=unclassified Streptomyces TaxID=2593676 RepID=UPI0036874051